MGFARSLGLGIRDFLSVPAKGVLQVVKCYNLIEACAVSRKLNLLLLLLQSPTGLISGMAQGTSSLVSNTVYALSDAATQFSKAAHKVCLKYDKTFTTGRKLMDSIIIFFL